MAKLIPAHVREQQINALPNISFVRWDRGEYRGVKSKAICRCEIDGHEWPAIVDGLINSGSGCPKCYGNILKTSAECEKLINDLPNIQFMHWNGSYKNSASRATCRCAIDGNEWSSSVVSLTRGRGCPQCGALAASDAKRIPAHMLESKINELPNIIFVRWDEDHKNTSSKAVCRCAVDGCEWVSTAKHLIGGHGCPQCARIDSANIRRTPSDERMSQINDLPNIKFVSWVGEYKNSRTKANCMCEICRHEWAATVNGLVTGDGSGCPRCSKTGFNASKRGTLYALRSSCGSMVKIGISNNHKKRHAILKRHTPFDWSCIELIHSDDGAFIAKAEKELHSLTEQAQFSEPFDGYTEWRKWDDRIPMWIEEYRARA